MCGIFGYVGKVSTNKQRALYRFIRNLAIASEARGVDATGFAARWSRNIMIADKHPCRASDFVKQSPKFLSLSKEMPSTFIGHTRLGTGSSPTINNNNHPFFGRRFHMVHNGIIPSWRTEINRHNLEIESETDSELILRAIEKRIFEKEDNISDSIEWTLANVWGNMAVALLDKRRPYIWLFRNENPIWIFEPPFKIFGSKMYFFCSTEAIFNDAWEKTFKKKFHEDDVTRQFLTDNQLYKLSSIPQKIGKKTHRFIWYPLSVTNKFRKKNQYYGPSTRSSSDTNGRYSTSNNTRSFYSKFKDTVMPQLGSEFNGETRIKIKAALESNDKAIKHNTFLDGLSVSDFVLLDGLKNDIKHMEDKVVKK